MTRSIAIVAVVAVVALVLGVAASKGRGGGRTSGLLPPRVTPLTSFPGNEFDSAISPDGRMVAFAWDSPQARPDVSIHVKQIDGGEPLRITTRSGDRVYDGDPAWSPDGRQIAFLRGSLQEGESGVYVVSALGGPARKVHGFKSALVGTSGLDWSVDGKTLVVGERESTADPYSLILLSLDTLNTRKLTHPLKQDGDYRPVFSPDGRSVVFARRTRDSSDLHVVSVAGGEPRRLTFDEVRVEGAAWTPDGQRIVFDSPRSTGTRTLWSIPAAGGVPEPLGIEAAADPSISLQGNRLIFTQCSDDTNIWRYDLANIAAPTPLFPSTRRDVGAHLSPDGGRIAFVSNRSGSNEIWTGGSDGSGVIQLTSLGKAFTAGPRWSRDGGRIVFESQASPDGVDLYVVGAQGGGTRRLINSGGRHNNVRPSWSRDGRFIYFASDRDGAWQVWKIPVDGEGEAVRVTQAGGYESQESMDGREIFYTKRDTLGIFRRSSSGGEEQRLVPHLQLSSWDSRGAWTVTSRGVYVVDAVNEQGPAIERVDLLTGKITRVLRLDRKPSVDAGVNVSPDEHWLILTRVDQSNCDLMLAERVP